MKSTPKTCLYFLAGLFFFCTSAWAQKPWTLQWGTEHKPENPGSIYRIVHTDQQGYYALRCRIPERLLSNKSHKAALELYDKKLNFVRSEAIDLEYKGESLEFANFVSLKDKHFLLTSYYNAKQEKKYLLVRLLNFESLSITHRIDCPRILYRMSKGLCKKSKTMGIIFCSPNYCRQGQRENLTTF